MKTTRTLHHKERHRHTSRPGSSAKAVSAKAVKKSSHIDIVWILMSVLLVLGMMLIIGIFYAMLHPTGTM